MKKIVNDSKEIADNLWKCFSEEGSRLCHEAVQRSKSTPVPKIKPCHVTSEFVFTNCNENEINEIIMRKKSQSWGVDEVSLKFVKVTKTIVIPILTHVINYHLKRELFQRNLN